MKYAIRALKYFLSMIVILVVVLGALTYYQSHTLNILASLENGWTSVGWILLILAGFSAAYPSFGYAERPLDIRGDQETMRQVINSYMEARHYRRESWAEDGTLTYRHCSPVTRFFRVYEDRVTFIPTHTGYHIEGLNRDIVRLMSGIEYQYKNRNIL